LFLASARAEPAREAKKSTWILDGSAGVPRLRSSGNFNVVGDLTLGWAAPRWGVVASGSAHAFALDSADTLSDLDAYSGQVEGWTRFGGERATFELFARFGASLYDTTFIQVPSGSVTFRDETSVTYEGVLLVGAQLQPADHWFVRVLAGGGVYNEEYNALRIAAGARTRVDGGIVDTSRFAGRAEGRVQLRWVTFPGWLSFRLRSEAKFYSLTRSSDVIGILGVKVTTTSATDSVWQLETSNRLFANAEVLKVMDIVPALFFGLDTLTATVEGASSTNLVPVIGVGLFKPEP
jgi:hypothetical protein